MKRKSVEHTKSRNGFPPPAKDMRGQATARGNDNLYSLEFIPGTRNPRPETRHLNPRPGEKGFTLVEIVTVIIFLGLLLVPVMAALARALIVSNEVEYLSVATFLAVEKMEETRAYVSCYSTIDDNCPGATGAPKKHVFDQEFNNSGSFPAPYQKYRWKVEYVRSNLTWSNNRLYEIQLRVWYDKNSSGAWDIVEPDVFLETEIYCRYPIEPNE